MDRRSQISSATSAPPTRYAGAIRTWRNTPTLQYSITPRGRIRGQPARRSLPEFQTTGRSREDDDEYEAPFDACSRLANITMIFPTPIGF